VREASRGKAAWFEQTSLRQTWGGSNLDAERREDYARDDYLLSRGNVCQRGLDNGESWVEQFKDVMTVLAMEYFNKAWLSSDVRVKIKLFRLHSFVSLAAVAKASKE